MRATVPAPPSGGVERARQFFFAALGIPLKSGRYFSESDTLDAPLSLW